MPHSRAVLRQSEVALSNFRVVLMRREVATLHHRTVLAQSEVALPHSRVVLMRREVATHQNWVVMLFG